MQTITRPLRNFLPEDFELTQWSDLEPFFQKLLAYEITSVEDLQQFLRDRSELESYLEEDFAWRYIDMNCDTENEAKNKKFLFFVQEIQPKISPISDKLNNKIAQSGFLEQLPEEYQIFARKLKNAIELFREKNVPIFTKIEEKSQQFGVVSSAMTVEHEGENLTMQQAGKLLESKDRNLRKKIFVDMMNRRLEDRETLDNLLTELITLRHEVAQNAGFDNFRDYKFKALDRFDYTPKDCEDFHEVVKQEIVPLIKKFHQKRKASLGLDTLRPWDMAVDIFEGEALHPFATSQELVDKTIEGFQAMNPKFAEYIEIMRNMKHFDLDSRKGKAPGGFNYPLYEIGVPFIFMNSVGSQRDLETMVHEGGHAIHSFLTRDLPIADLKSTPSEVAELASQSMELFSIEFWDLFYKNPSDLERAKLKKMEDSISILPWVCMVDKFQHWLYLHPTHSNEDREKMWISIMNEFSTEEIDFTGYEQSQRIRWQAQLHIFEVPFYYIEYGFSQLGSIAMWKNFLTDREKTLQDYVNFMKLGSTKSIPEIYETAGISFDFSRKYLKELAGFILDQ